MRLTHLTVPALASITLLVFGLMPSKVALIRRAAPVDPQLAAEAALACERTRPSLQSFEGGAP